MQNYTPKKPEESAIHCANQSDASRSDESSQEQESIAQEYIYKIVTEDEFQRIQKQGAFDGSELDHKDGFIHCSLENQIDSTIQKFFKGESNLILLTINPEGLDIRFEKSPRSNHLYPHIFEPLPIENVVASKKIA